MPVERDCPAMLRIAVIAEENWRIFTVAERFGGLLAADIANLIHYRIVLEWLCLMEVPKSLRMRVPTTQNICTLLLYQLLFSYTFSFAADWTIDPCCSLPTDLFSAKKRCLKLSLSQE